MADAYLVSVVCPSTYGLVMLTSAVGLYILAKLTGNVRPTSAAASVSADRRQHPHSGTWKGAWEVSSAREPIFVLFESSSSTLTFPRCK